MKLFYRYIFIFLILLIGCNKKNIDGKFFRIKGNDRGGLLGGFFGNFISELEFTDDYCKFVYFGMPMNGKYEIDKGYVFVDVGGEMGILSLEIIDENTLEGEGFVSGTYKKLTTFKASNKPAIGYFWTTAYLNIRSGPGTDYAKIETIKNGTKVKVVEKLGAWYKIEKDGYEGFASSSYLREER